MVDIKRNPNADSRTALPGVTKAQLHEASLSHINDVQRVMTFLAAKLKEHGKIHDWTKIEKEELFYDNFINLKAGKEFMEGPWFQDHVHTERHHPNVYCHEDIDLLDILESIVDQVCAGKARKGQIDTIEFSPEVLAEAVNNTIRLIDKNTIVKGEIN